MFHAYQLFLFDFDGLLVNTEELHFRAYQTMCIGRGIKLTWSFPRYCQAAHFDAEALRDQIYEEYPALKKIEPCWEVLYAEKKKAYIELIKQGNITLMPGVSDILKILQQENIKRCVVTHSARELVDIIRAQHPILNTLPHWLTREDYSRPKPHPDGYLKAIELLASPSDKIIGFEDTPRGLKSLQGTRAKPILITAMNHPETESLIQQGVRRFDSFTSMLAHSE